MQWHEVRFLHTQQDNWGKVKYEQLEKLIKTHPNFPKDHQKYKCRVVYSPEEFTITFTPYVPRTISKLQLVNTCELDYSYKSTDRRKFSLLTSGLTPDTEILIIKNGLLTDSSFSNLALFDGQHWHTPRTPLLCGVHRSHLLQKSLLIESQIMPEQIRGFQKIRLMNAMMDWEHTWELPITSIG